MNSIHLFVVLTVFFGTQCELCVGQSGGQSVKFYEQNSPPIRRLMKNRVLEEDRHLQEEAVESLSLSMAMTLAPTGETTLEPSTDETMPPSVAMETESPSITPATGQPPATSPDEPSATATDQPTSAPVSGSSAAPSSAPVVDSSGNTTAAPTSANSTAAPTTSSVNSSSAAPTAAPTDPQKDREVDGAVTSSGPRAHLVLFASLLPVVTMALGLW